MLEVAGHTMSTEVPIEVAGHRRCLINCGWINFRMRAMVVSFAAYNLWLDWRRFDAPLARLFLDFEPGKKHLKHGDL